MARNPRGYIRRRGRWIASAPYYAHGKVVLKRKRKAKRRKPKRRRYARRNPGNPRGKIPKGRRVSWVRGYTYRRRKPRRRRVEVTRYWKPRRRRRRRARRNPANPRYYAPRRRRRARGYRRRAHRLRKNPIAAIQSAFEDAFSAETLETLFHTSVGIGGSLVGAKLLGDLIPALGEGDIAPIATTAGVSIIGSGVAGMITGDATFASRFLVGGMIATSLRLLGVVLPSEAKAWVPTVGLGQAETDEFRRAIEAEVMKELREGDEEGMSVYLRPAGVEQHYVKPAGAEAYLTQRESREAAGMGAFMTEREAVEAGMGMRPTEEIGPGGMPEKF